MTERRRRCMHCKELKRDDEIGYRGSSGAVVCVSCETEARQASAERYERYQRERAAEIEARTSEDHLRIAREPLVGLRDRRDQYGHLEVSAVMIDVHTLEWLIAQAERMVT